jgi:hypothetical protein
MRFTAIIGLAICMAALTAAPAQSLAPQQPPRLKVRLEVGKKIANLFVIKDGRVVLNNVVELTLLRGCEVELMVVDRDLTSGVQPEPKLVKGVHRLHIQQTSEFPGMLAAPPSFPGPDGKKLGMHVPYVGISFMGLGTSGSVQGQINLQNEPTAADWEKVRLAGLSQVDGKMRQILGDSLVMPARLVFHEKPGWYVENPHPFVIRGKAYPLAAGKESKPVPFRIAPGFERIWIDTNRFIVRDIEISAPDQPAPAKSAKPAAGGGALPGAGK